jgi:hypothetical protein
MTDQKTNWKYILIVIGLAALAGAGILFYWWQIEMGVANMPQTLNSEKITEPEKPLDISNWKVYKNLGYGFEFLYPDDWYIKEEAERFFLFDSRSCQGTCPKENSNIGFGVENNNELLPVSEWIKQNVAAVGIEADASFSVDSAQGIKRTYKGENVGSTAILAIFAQKNKLNTLYYFETSGFENRRILEQILLNFNFLK